MKATYIGTGARDDDETCTVFGVDFKQGEAVDVSGLTEEQRNLLDGNPTFETDSKPKKSAAAPAATPPSA